MYKEFNSVQEFLDTIRKEHSKMLMLNHQYGTPIYYEIDELNISFLMRYYLPYKKSDLYKLMLEIADYTNNKMDVGCAFTMS